MFSSKWTVCIILHGNCCSISLIKPAQRSFCLTSQRLSKLVVVLFNNLNTVLVHVVDVPWLVASHRLLMMLKVALC